MIKPRPTHYSYTVYRDPATAQTFDRVRFGGPIGAVIAGEQGRVLANFVGMVISYRLSRYWTFKHRPPQHADGGRTAFFLINLVTLPLAVGTRSRDFR